MDIYEGSRVWWQDSGEAAWWNLAPRQARPRLMPLLEKRFSERTPQQRKRVSTWLALHLRHCVRSRRVNA